MPFKTTKVSYAINMFCFNPYMPVILKFPFKILKTQSFVVISNVNFGDITIFFLIIFGYDFLFHRLSKKSNLGASKLESNELHNCVVSEEILEEKPS